MQRIVRRQNTDERTRPEVEGHESQGRRVADAVPVPVEQTTTSEYSRILEELFIEHVEGMSIPGITAEMDHGHERPALVFQEISLGRMYVNMEFDRRIGHVEMRETERARNDSWGPYGSFLAWRFHALYNSWREQERDYVVTPAMQRTADRTLERVLHPLLTEEYLGPDVYRRVNLTPPIILPVSNTFMELQRSYFERDYAPIAMYLNGTNIILVNSDYLGSDGIDKFIIHELHHYFSYLGGGFDVRFGNGPYDYNQIGYVRWIQEGFTEFFSLETVSRTGEVASIGYENETNVAFRLCQICGYDVVLRAYMSGNFTELRDRVNNMLNGRDGEQHNGLDFFQRLMAAQNGRDALRLLTQRMRQQTPNLLTTDLRSFLVVM